MTVPSHARFHPVIFLPEDYMIYDFSKGPDPRRKREGWGVGKYNEKRPAMYNTPLFSGVRDIHLGVDISGPVGTPIHAFDDGQIFLTGYNGAEGDYGYTIITKHDFDGRELYALWGHLQKRSIEGKAPGQGFARGEVIAWIGDSFENGGWNPHLHFQLSWEKPPKCDMPGVVSDQDLAAALEKYPDPRIVLGPLY